LLQLHRLVDAQQLMLDQRACQSRQGDRIALVGALGLGW
jgi:hypothetical protein